MAIDTTQRTFCFQCHVHGCFQRVTRSAHDQTHGIISTCEDHDPNVLGRGLPLPCRAAFVYVPETPGRPDFVLPAFAPTPAPPAALGLPDDDEPRGGGQRTRRKTPPPTPPAPSGASVVVAPVVAPVPDYLAF